jgi:uncharacterized protein (DUF302 family)
MNNDEIEIFKIVNMSFNEAINKVTEALKVEGFGVLTEIDVKQTMKIKLNVDFEQYKILGACNPQLAYKALEIDRAMGVLLPCNVYVQEIIGQNKTKISAVNPKTMFNIVNDKKFEPIVKEVNDKLRRVMESL